MNKKAIQILKNCFYSLFSNFISFFISSLIVIVIPKLIGMDQYGYWQIYLFYSLYLGFLHFGWADGIYLRYGGGDYEKLDKEMFFSQFYMFLFFQIFISLIIIIPINIFVIDINKKFIFEALAICLVILNLRYMLLYILQATNKIKEYAKINTTDRLLYCLFIILPLILGLRDFKLMIAADLVAKCTSLIYAIFLCRDIVIRKGFVFHLTLHETIENIRSGIKLMFAAIASMLIIGVIRLGIERNWDVVTFGKISLTLSVSNLLMIFINAIGIVLFPMLRRTDGNKLAGIYLKVRTLLMAFLLATLIIYFPIKELLLIWLPQYSESLKYMVIIFPMSIFEGVMSLLVNTYLKTLRKEKLMLIINFLSLILSVVSTIIFTFLLKNLSLSVLSIVILLGFRCVLSELMLAKAIKISLKDIPMEIILIVIFMAVGWFVSSWHALSIYVLFYIIYLYIKRKSIIDIFKDFKLLIGC